eukprot:g1702.t1
MVASRCVQAKDLDRMLETVDLMKQRGFPMDLHIYTNMISVYGVIGRVNDAFGVYSELKASGLVPDVTVLGALANACAIKLKTPREGERRQDLVLLERAVDLLQDLHDYKIGPDTTMWNILVSCAGRAGQLHRAFNLFRQMKEFHCTADSNTYCSLIDACVKAKDRQLGLKIYRLAIEEVPQVETALYTIAIEACMCGEEPVDVDTVFEIYREANQADLVLDTHFFTTLIRAVGKGGALDEALSIEDNMRLQGVERSTNSCSALLAASLACSDLNTADKIYKKMSSKGIYPGTYQFTNLMQAYIRARRFGDMVVLLDDMISAANLELDDVVLATILTACLHAGLNDIGFTVFTLLRARGVRITSIVCQAMLSICLDELMTYRVGTGVRPKGSMVENTEGIALLKVLCKDRELPPVQSASAALWTDRALSIYRAVYSNGLPGAPLPTLEILNKLYSCLRVPYRLQKTQSRTDYSSPEDLKFCPYREDFQPPITESKDRREECFDRRILQLVKEGMTQGLLEQFNVEHPTPVNLKELPPVVAEGYVFTIMETLRFRFRNKSHYRFKWVFKVEPFDPKKALIPSNGLKTGDTPSTDVKSKGEATSLGVVALLRRLRIWHKTVPHHGVIIILGRVLNKWITEDDYSFNSDRTGTGTRTSPDKNFSSEISVQQRKIRTMNRMRSKEKKEEEEIED